MAWAKGEFDHNDHGLAPWVILWKPWTGGPCPVEGHRQIQVRTAIGEEDCEYAKDFDWEWTQGLPGDYVIAYRELPTEKHYALGHPNPQY